MTTIEGICNAIKNFFNKVRKPFPQLPRELIVCSAAKRPGLSVIYSTANVIQTLNKMGFPTGPMPDGSVNMTNMQVYAIMSEVVRMVRNDLSIQVGIVPGSASITVVGGNAGGTMVSNGTITNACVAYGAGF